MSTKIFKDIKTNYYVPPSFPKPAKLIISGYEKMPSYTMVRMERTASQTDLLSDLEKWCIKCNCGKRVNKWSFAFKTEEELLMFKLRWA